MPGLPIALLAFAAGATLLQWQPVLPPIAPSLIVAGIAAGVAVALRRARAHRHGAAALASHAVTVLFAALVAAAAGALGFGYAAWRADTRLADALPVEWEGADIALVGVIDELPQASARGTRFAFALETVETANATVPARLSLAWYARQRKDGTSELPPALAAGERWRLVVRLKRPHGNVNPHGFDIEAWLLENNLRATGYVRRDARNARLDAFAGRPSDWVQRARERVRTRILAALPESDYAGVIVALAIGDQRAISEPQWRIFNRTGITHLISITQQSAI